MDRLGAPSVDSYVAYARRVERELELDLDVCDLTDAGVAAIATRLRAGGVPDKSIRNCRSALRAYAEFRDGAPRAPAARPAMSITPDQRQAWAAKTATSPFNRWLDGQVQDASGRLDLARLHDVALAYGVDRRAAYAQLNAGQQRMNLGNLLRGVVPPSVYAPTPAGVAEEVPEVAPDAPDAPVAPPVSSPPDPPARREAVRQGSVSELLVLYGEIMDELRERGVIRTGNSPVGDYAELLFARAFSWSLAPNSASGHDATDALGLRYQIKARRLSHAGASRQLSAIRRLDAQTFDYLAAVLLDPGFKVTRAILVPHAVVAARARRTEHTNSWTFILDDRVWKDPGVRDVTAEIAVAASQL